MSNLNKSLLILLALICIIIASFPAVTNMFTGEIINKRDIDIAGNFWLINHFQKNRLTEPSKFFFTPLICAPFGYDIRYTFFNLLPGFLYSLVINFDHLAFSYNLLLILCFAFNFAAMFLLANYVIKNPLLSIAASFLFIMTPHYFWALSIGKLESLLYGFVPLSIYFYIRSGDSNGKKSLFLSAASGIVAGLSSGIYVYYVSFILLFVGLYELYAIILNKKTLPTILRSIAFLIMFLLVFIPIILPFAEVLSHEGASLKETNMSEHSRFLSANDAFMDYPTRPHLIISLLLLASLIRKPWKDPVQRFWLILTTFFLILTLGNGIKFSEGFSLRMPLYYMRMYIPAFSRFYWPERMHIMFYLSAGIYIFKTISPVLNKKTATAAAVGVILLVTADMTVFFPFYPLDHNRFFIPDIYTKAATAPGSAVHVPVFSASQTEVIFQIWHKNPISDHPYFLGGFYSLDKDFVELYKTNQILQRLVMAHFKVPQKAFTNGDLKEDIGQLRKLGITNFYLHKNLRNMPATNMIYFIDQTAMKKALGYDMFSTVRAQLNHDIKLQNCRLMLEHYFGPPVYEDSDNALFTLKPAAGIRGNTP